MLPVFVRRRLGSEIDRSLTFGGLSALSLRVGGTAILLVLQVLLTRTLGPEHYGDYIYALSWINVLAVVATCGLDTASLRFVPAYKGTGDQALLRGFLRRSVQIVLLVSLILATVLAGLVAAFHERIPDGLDATFLAGCFLLPAAALLLLVASLLRGFKHVATAMAPQFVLRPLLLCAGVFGLYLSLPGGRPEAVHVMALDAFVAIGLALAMFRFLRRNLPESARSGERRYELRLWIATARPLLAISAIRLAMNKVDVLMIGLLIGTTTAGVYAIATQLAALISFGLFAVNIIAAPLIAQLHAQQRHDDLQRLVRLGALATSTFALTTGASLLLLGKAVLVLFGPAFVAAYPPLCVLVMAQLVNSLTGSVGFLMTMTGHEKAAAKVSAFTGTLNVVLTAVLIPHLGVLGAALATATATITWNVVLVIMVKRYLNLDSTVFSRAPR